MMKQLKASQMSVDQNLIRAAAEKISADLDSADSIDLRKYRDP
mgnify:CR=1 FL=1